jgi:endogenous inhibitor of DNA gyrase (YacG/DUF329 family)
MEGPGKESWITSQKEVCFIPEQSEVGRRDTMTESYTVTCPHCGERVATASWQAPGKCPACGAEIGLSEDAGYRPALSSPVAKIIARVILIIFGAILLVGLIALAVY